MITLADLRSCDVTFLLALSSAVDRGAVTFWTSVRAALEDEQDARTHKGHPPISLHLPELAPAELAVACVDVGTIVLHARARGAQPVEALFTAIGRELAARATGISDAPQ